MRIATFLLCVVFIDVTTITRRHHRRRDQMRLSIARLGSSSGVARCMYSTFDMSAIAGQNYVGVADTWVQFEKGESSKDVYIKVKPNDAFNGTTEFGLYIDEKNAEGAAVGKFLHTCSIKIIDQSVFPSERLRAWVAGGDKDKIMQIPPGKLIVDFVKLCWEMPVCKAGTKKVILTHQYNSFQAILTIFVIL
jgi:hypothetical protein